MAEGDSARTSTPSVDARERAEGRVLAGRYRVLRRLGTGGMASVYLAEDQRLGRQVAVKRLHTGRPEEDARRFAREARLGAILNHPNLVTVFDTVSDEESVLIVMEYVGGTDLATVLGSGPLAEEEGMRILQALASAIDHAHQHGIVHRDIKPANVLVRGDGQVKLADLGIARALEDTAITHSGVVLGTLLYIAPEALQGEEVGPEADVYSLALIALEVLSGKRARQEGTVAQVTHRAVNEPPPDLRELRPDVPAAAAEILSRALDPDPSRRPGSASALMRDLAQALARRDRPAVSVEERGVPAPPVEEPPPAPVEEPSGTVREEPPAVEPAPEPTAERRLRGPLAAIAAVLALAAIVVFAVVALSGGGSGDEGGGGKGATKSAGAAEGQGGGAVAPPASTASPTTPDGAVQSFYARSAAGDYRGAWSLADSNFRSQLGGFSAFESQQSTLESIEFPTIEVTSESGSSATVSFSTVATHTSFTDRCTGSMSLVASGGTWLIDQARDITCERSAG